MSINKVIISGNLTRDAEALATPRGTNVMRLGVAVNERVRDSEGNWTDRPNFVDCVMFGDRAKKLAPALKKGAKVCVEGKLRWSQWERDGEKRSKIEVVIDEIEFLSPRQQQPASAYDDDLPF